MCSRWYEARISFEQITEREFNEPHIMESLPESENRWNIAYNTVRHIMETKGKQVIVNEQFLHRNNAQADTHVIETRRESFSR